MKLYSETGSMTAREFYEELEFILEMEPNTIRGAEALDNFNKWDSLAKIAFISMVRVKLDTEVSVEALLACKTVSDLVSLLNGNIISQDRCDDGNSTDLKDGKPAHSV